MTSLITILIALLGYGTPSDFSHMTEAELQTEIAALEADGGNAGDWDAGVTSDDDENNDGGNAGDWDAGNP